MRIRIRSIYTKFLLGFFALLLIEIMLMVVWTFVFMGNVLDDEALIDADAQGKLMRMALREAAAAAPALSPVDNPRVVALVEEFAGYYRAEGWLVDEAGEVVYATTDKGLPEVASLDACRLENITFYNLPGYGWMEPDRIYAIVDVDMGRWGRMSLHARFRDTHDGTVYLRYVLIGQIVVALAIALIIFPVSRFFTMPLRRLEKVVLEYADGRLESRFPRTRRDEIGELGRAFNVMADNLETMIRSSRELVANVSHELRSPLTRLRISEEMLRDRADGAGPAGDTRHLDNIREEVEHLDGLIGRMLEITRLDVRETEFRPLRVDLSDLSLGMAARYDGVREHRQVLFRVQVAGQMAVPGNADSLASVLTNLLDNAFKYCPRQGRVLLGLDRDRDGRVRLRVENTHAPLPAQELEAIFRPFHRAGTRNRQGYGLGLAIVRKIVEHHGGRVTAANIEDGVRFEVILPPWKSPA